MTVRTDDAGVPPEGVPPEGAAAPAETAGEPGPPALACWNCNASLAGLPRPITRHMNCPECYEDLHCCRMCRHYRDNVTNSCADERAAPPTHKEGANFCDFFRPAAGSYRSGTAERQTRAKSSLNALFADEGDTAGGPDGEDAAPAPATAEDEARRRLDALFR